MLQFNSTFNRKSWFLNYFQMHYASRGVFFTPNIYTRDNITGYSRKISLTENITVMFQHIVKFYCYTAWWIDRGCLHVKRSKTWLDTTINFIIPGQYVLSSMHNNAVDLSWCTLFKFVRSSIDHEEGSERGESHFATVVCYWLSLLTFPVMVNTFVYAQLTILVTLLHVI